ncbi:aldo/keto reductase [Elstera cyanobacteriorum]|uniref:aldo/keto reductase n=1 Tax=Elstera cyanobacteriorum TaxID=2022747 RepID=UPI002354407B|nr:aldo/keto reductase [Elstera cyanobacteriorum]MCK6442363.1 aldo/keto reductase [Elstera cyanobacteriorum]
MSGFSRLPLYHGGPMVGRLGFGTVALGLAYGVGPEAVLPPEDAAIATLRAARAGGVDFFDTAPAYGVAEQRTGLALGGDAGAVIATKILLPKDISDFELPAFVHTSVVTSLTRLKRNRLDLLKIHNATAADMDRRPLLDALRAEVDAGRVTALGASVYGPEDAAAVIATPGFKSVQIAFSILDQRCRAIFAQAGSAGVGLVVRSALLKGALTIRARHLPPALAPLADAASQVCALAGIGWEELPTLAMRYVLSVGAPISVVLAGAQSQAELNDALRALDAGPLPPALMAKLDGCGLTDDALLNPARWPALS